MLSWFEFVLWDKITSEDQVDSSAEMPDLYDTFKQKRQRNFTLMTCVFCVSKRENKIEMNTFEFFMYLSDMYWLQKILIQ